MSFFKSHILPYNQLTTPRFHIEVLVLQKITKFQEKVTTTHVPAWPQILTEITQVFLIKYLQDILDGNGYWS